jgi:hypothetical protein
MKLAVFWNMMLLQSVLLLEDGTLIPINQATEWRLTKDCKLETYCHEKLNSHRFFR